MKININKRMYWIVIVLTGVLIIFIANTNFLIQGYSSMDEILRKHNKFRNSEILDVIESNDVSLVIYKKDGTYETTDIFYKDNKYYTYRNLNFIKRKHIKADNVFINISTHFDKTQICIINCKKDGSIVVTDTLDSIFKISKVKSPVNNKSAGYFFLSLNEIPHNYKIIIDGEEILIN